MKNSMKAAVYQGKQRFEVEEVPVPDVGPGQILCKIKYCGICGTDVHGFMFDVVPPGMIIGHESVGTVAEVGPGVTKFKVGDRVAGGGGARPPHIPDPVHSDPRFNFRTSGWAAHTPLYAHAYAEYVTMADWETIRVPDGVPDREAAMTEPLAHAVHTVKRSGLKLGDSVGIIGAGPIGLFCLQAARAAGATTVIVSEPAPVRRQAAMELGADVVIDPTNTDVGSEMAALTDGQGPHVVLECAGVPGTLQVALDAVRRAGKVVTGAICWEEQPIRTVDWISRMPELTTVYGYGPQADGWPIAFELMERGMVKVEPMLTKDAFITLDRLQEAFEGLMKSEMIKVIVEP